MFLEGGGAKRRGLAKMTYFQSDEGANESFRDLFDVLDQI